MTRFGCLLLTLSLYSGCTGGLGWSNTDPDDTTRPSDAPAAEASETDAYLLSAFYGLDDALPLLGRVLLCRSPLAGGDGMPVVFSRELDIETLQAGDLRVVLEDGSLGRIACVTPAPATDTGEFRTVLLIGDLGSVENQPAHVEVRGNVLSKDQQFNFLGRQVPVTRLEGGPSLVFAERVPPAEWDLEKPATRFPFGGGSGCPKATKQVVRVVWNGGITKPGGDEIDDLERRAYRVFIRGDSEDLQETSPIAVGDLGDGDNNHELCLDTAAPVVRVAFPAELLTDPREDLNPVTEVTLPR